MRKMQLRFLAYRNKFPSGKQRHPSNSKAIRCHRRLQEMEVLLHIKCSMTLGIIVRNSI